MKFRSSNLIFFFLLISITNACAQDEHEKLAREFVEINSFAKIFDEFHENCIGSANTVSPEGMLEIDQDYFNGVTPESKLWPEAVKIFNEYYEEACSYTSKEEFIEIYVKEYASNLTADELKKAINFYSTELGGKLIDSSISGNSIFQNIVSTNIAKNTEKANKNFLKKMHVLGERHKDHPHSKKESSPFLESYKAIAKEQDYQIRLSLINETLSNANKYERFTLLPTAAKTAFEANNFALAKLYATELQDTQPNYTNDWNFGNAIHDSNMVLGRLAVQDGDIKLGVEYLLNAGKSSGSPQLNTFGPNMSLAKDLIEAGELDAVIEYFDLCRKFWELEEGRLDSWTASIRGGGMPDFRANLRY